MSFKVVSEIHEGSVEMRNAFCQTLQKLAEKDDRIYLLDADLMGAMGTKPFRAQFPERTIDCGIQEANMIGVAAGLSAEGKIPFAHTFGVFASRRACDQVYLSCAYAGQNVKVIGSDPGITSALNGGTHMAFEDLGIMRGIPEMTVIEPTDTVMLQNIIPKAAEMYGSCYIRLVRRTCPEIYKAGSDFTIGKANMLRDGKDATIIAMGYCVAQSMRAAARLEEDGISVRVVDMFTLKPIDRQAVIAASRDTGAIVTAENHSINNALGSAVSEILCEEAPAPLIRIGAQDRFGIVGQRDDLAKTFGMDEDSIYSAVKKVIAKKV